MAIMQNKPLISVVIPTLNIRKQFLKEAINSIEKQSYLPLEVIIVNNGERNLELPETFLKIRRFDIVFRAGVAQARNFGASLAIGEYIAFLDDDDLWGKNYLRNIKKKIDIEHSDCLIGRLDYFLNDKIIPYKNAYGQINKETILIKNPGITGSSVVIKKDVFLIVGGYNPKLPASEDKTLILELIDRGFKITVVSDSQAIYRHSDIERLTNNNNLYEGIFQFYRIYKHQMSLYQKVINLFKMHDCLWRSNKTFLNRLKYIFFLICIFLARLIKEKKKT